LKAFGSFVDGAAVLALSILVAGLSILFFRQAADGVDRMALAGRLERREAVDPGRVARQADAALRDADAAGSLCNLASRKADVAIVLHHLADQNQAADFDAWTRAASDADRMLRRSLRCSPQDGDLWARLALVDRVIVVAPPRVAAMLRMSESLAPSEVNVIRMRSRLWGIGASTLDPQTREAALRDLATMLQQSKDTDARGVLESFRPAMQGDIERLAAGLEPERRDALDRRAALRPPEAPPPPRGPRLLFLDGE
jgi:hypothetical protein